MKGSRLHSSVAGKLPSFSTDDETKSNPLLFSQRMYDVVSYKHGILDIMSMLLASSECGGGYAICSALYGWVTVPPNLAA